MTTEFLAQANLPTSKVRLVAISLALKDLIDSLEKHRIECLTVEPSSNLQRPVMSHADMNIVHMGGNAFGANKINTDIIDKITTIGGSVVYKADLAPDYPNDIKLNIAIIGNRVVCNSYYADDRVLDYLGIKGKRIIHVNQGYSRCSTAVVNEHSIMTADKSMYNTYLENGFNCLLLESGDIELAGYNYGFIGGCCGLIDKDVMAFTGDINKYSEGERVKEFLCRNNCDYVCLTENKLIDIGGIIPLKQDVY